MHFDSFSLSILSLAASNLLNISCDEGAWTASRHVQYDTRRLSERVSHIKVQDARCCEETVEHTGQEEGGGGRKLADICHGNHPLDGTYVCMS